MRIRSADPANLPATLGVTPDAPPAVELRMAVCGPAMAVAFLLDHPVTRAFSNWEGRTGLARHAWIPLSCSPFASLNCPTEVRITITGLSSEASLVMAIARAAP